MTDKINTEGDGANHDECCLKGSSQECCSAPRSESIKFSRQSAAGTGCACDSSNAKTELAAVEHITDSCCSSGQPSCDSNRTVNLQLLPMAQSVDDEPCCGPPQGPPSSPYERPGYILRHFVDGFIQTPVGLVPKVATRLRGVDFFGKVRARIGIRRDRYKVAPGLYCTGNPGPDAPVLVTANYKLSFDSLRQELFEVNAWIMVLDTRGINVWCAAGKKNFSTDEVIRQVTLCGLDKVVNHRQLLLPQLGAPGVSAHQVKKGCGFSVKWGPIRAADLKEFLSSNYKASPAMRQVTFTLKERLVLIPVELMLIMKPSFWILAAIFLLSGISPDVFSFDAIWLRGAAAALAYFLGIFAGAVAVPALLPWLPGRQFFLKGMLAGLLSGMMVLPVVERGAGMEVVSLVFLSMSVGSYAAMNFTGATPFTSPSGVEKEMRRGMPFQACAVFIAAIFWIAGPFMK